jgi:hypothetical protein
MAAYNDANNAFPAPDGRRMKVGLSWRVHLLPYVEQGQLHNEFNQDEPWDSAHNLKLIEKMPKVYASPLVSDPPGQTRYKVFSGKGAAFEPGRELRPTEFTDGVSNTILIVGGGRPVAWTKPDDIEFTGGEVQPSVLALPGQTGCNVCLGDGSVHWIELSRINPRTLKALITRNGGELLPPNWQGELNR